MINITPIDLFILGLEVGIGAYLLVKEKEKTVNGCRRKEHQNIFILRLTMILNRHILWDTTFWFCWALLRFCFR